MEKLIKEKLQEVEKQFGVSILFACETGSRAWGFPSPDSDYDVRFIYRHPKNWYLSIDEAKDTVEYLNGDLDLVGWDIRKSLKLLRKSNAAMFERLQSSILYMGKTSFRENLIKLLPEYFSHRASLHHYLSMALNYYKACAPVTEVKLKSYFYLLRTALASLWIVEKQTIPPLQFRELLLLVKDSTIQAKIKELLLLKATVNETYLHPKETELELFIINILSYCETKKDIYPPFRGDTEPLDKLFRITINQTWP